MFLVLLAANPACGQTVRRKPKSPPKFPQFDLSGTLDHVDGNVLALTTAAGYKWTLRPAAKVQVRISGKAVPAFLASGQAIAFFGKLDTRHAVTVEEVHRLTVFTPDERRRFAIQPDLGFGDLEKESFEGLRQTDDSKASDDSPTNAARESTPQAGGRGGQQGKRLPKKTVPRNIDSFFVSGRLLSMKKKGELIVAVPNNGFVKAKTLTVAVANDADITVEIVGSPTLLNLVQPGDHVQASGDQVGEGLGLVKDVRFRLDRLLSAPSDAKRPGAEKGNESRL
jgi:hypothetical protein